MPKKGNTLGNPAALALIASQTAKGGGGGESQALPAPAMAPPAVHYMPVPEQRTVNYLWAGAGVLVGSGILFLILRSIVRGTRFKKAINKTDDTDEPANYAQRIYNAFNPDTPWGWGTDEELLRRTIKAVPHRKFWDRVKVEYHKLTKGRNLMADMAGELSRATKREMDLILEMLPENQRDANNHDPNQVTEKHLQAWAERIKSAADYEATFFWPYGTDEEAIYEVLRELPTAAALCDLNETYHRMYGKGVLTELTDEMSGDDLTKAYNIITSKSDAQGKTITQIITRCIFPSATA